MLLKAILWLLSQSPVFALTYDKNYGDFSCNWSTEDRKRILKRFSAVQLRCGNTTVYFLTVVIAEKKLLFQWAHKITLEECQWSTISPRPMSERNDYIKELSKKYVDEHLEKLQKNAEELEIEKEFLQYLQENLSYRKSLSYDKMNFYTTVILVFVPLAPSFFDRTFSTYIQSHIMICGIYGVLTAFLIYALLNWGLLAFQYMTVSSMEKSAFREIKDPPEERSRIAQQLYSYYHDWQQERFDTDLRVAYVKQTEVTVRCATVLLIMLALCGPVTKLIDRTYTNHTSDDVNYLYSMEVGELGDPFSADSVEIAELHADIRRYQPKRLVVITSGNVNVETAAAIEKNFYQYEKSVEILIYVDQSLTPDEFKIAMIGG